jgi:hypothetical protein
VKAEAAPKGGPGDLGEEVEQKSTEERGRAAYDAERYGSMSVATLQRLPDSNAKAFMVAFALGASLNSAGTSEKVRSGKQVSGSLIRKHRLPVVLEALNDLDPSQWRRYVRDWTGRHIAHKCGPREVCLFRLPNLLACPACGVELNDFDLHPIKSEVRKPRGPGFVDRGRNRPTAETGAIVPPDGSIAPVSWNKRSRSAEQRLPHSSTAAPHRVPGITGKEVGKEPCPDCGARSSAVGYWGHGMSCRRYYEMRAVTASPDANGKPRFHGLEVSTDA